MDKPPHLKFEKLLEGAAPVSLINEPIREVEEARLSARERAERRWFKQNENE